MPLQTLFGEPPFCCNHQHVLQLITRFLSQSSPSPRLVLTSSSPHPHLILTSSSPLAGFERVFVKAGATVTVSLYPELTQFTQVQKDGSRIGKYNPPLPVTFRI